MIAITGATGAVGGRVARLLADLRPTLVVRDPARAPAGFEVRRASYGEPDACRAAFDGVDTLLLVSAAESPDRRREHRNAIDAAAEAGVSHLVYTSFAGAAVDAIFSLGRDHHDAEEAIRAAAGRTGMRMTLLRDNFYADLLPHFADAAGVIRGPAEDGRVAAVARADVADAAAAVLRDPDAHVGAAYDLTGPEALTMAEVAERAGPVIGRELHFVNETVDEAYASRRAAYPDASDFLLDAWVSTYRAIASGELAHVSDDVRRLTGHPPRSLEEALRTR